MVLQTPIRPGLVFKSGRNLWPPAAPLATACTRVSAWRWAVDGHSVGPRRKTTQMTSAAGRLGLLTVTTGYPDGRLLKCCLPLSAAAWAKVCNYPETTPYWAFRRPPCGTYAIILRDVFSQAPLVAKSGGYPYAYLRMCAWSRYDEATARQANV